MSRYIAAIDQGTTSTRCILFDRQGPVAAAQKEHRQFFPRPGWVEHDPLEIWQRTSEVVAEAMQKAACTAADLAAVGIANQRETTVVWNRTTGRPYRNAIVWQDTRTAEICRQLQAEEAAIRQATGLPVATYFSATKLGWMLTNVAGLQSAAQRGEAIFGTIDSWLIWQLTGEHVIDVTNASRTQLMNLRTLDWDEGLLELFGVPRAMLPRIVPSIDPQGWGRTRAGGPFGEGVIVCGDLGDQQAALLGQVCTRPGESKCTYGTGCFLLVNTGTEPVASKQGLLTTAGYQVRGQPPVYALEGSVAVTGSLIQWLRDNLGLIATSAESEMLARTVEDNGGVYFVPAFSGLFAPYWRSDARGVIVGMTGHTHRGHLARAALEATAYQVRDLIDAITKDTGAAIKRLNVDGGMTHNELLMQFQADVLGIPVARAGMLETTALGAAYAAGLAVGFWRDLDELRASAGTDREWRPTMDAAQREALLSGWRRAVERSFGLA